MNINKYCEQCDVVWKKDIKFCEKCGQTVKTINFNNNKICTNQSDESLSDIGKKLGKKVLSSVVQTTSNAKKAYTNYQDQKKSSSQKLNTHSPTPKDKDYRELLIVCNTIKSIGRIIMSLSKGIFFLLLVLGVISFFGTVSKGIHMAIASIIIPLLFGFIICLPIYIIGLIMTAVPQIINLIHDIRDNLVAIYKKICKIYEKISAC